MSADRQSPGTIWITGLSASGKSSVARMLAGELRVAGTGDFVLLDGDEFRSRLDRSYGHDLNDRFAVLRLLVEAVREEHARGRAVIVATISHKREMRAHARSRLGRFMEVHLHCPVTVCAARDPNGLYRRAFAGEYACFPGVTEPYEHSSDAELTLDTSVLPVAMVVERLLPAATAFLGAGQGTEAPAAAPAPAHANISLRVREKCAQLFYVYAGIAGRPGMNGLRFLLESKLADRNLAMIRDPYNDDFIRGVGDGLDDIEALVEWHESFRRSLGHVSEIYCVGNSMGGYAAVLFAWLLGARAAWAFGLRPAGGRDRVEDLRRLIDGAAVPTRYHLYYSSHDAADRSCAELLAPCGGVVLHPLDEVPTDRSHMVMSALADAGLLGELFPAFQAATR